jgi:3-phenylpropionate/trans-cinnamate dioxygenase ferredoxin reductase component
MTIPSRIVIIGASLAGGSAALALREQGYDGELTVIGEEAHRPYERPPLSKAVLLGETDEPDWVGDDAFWSESATLLTGTVASSIDRERRVVRAGGSDIPFDKLVIATGSAPRRLSVSGADLEGVHTLRTIDDALTLRARLTDGADVVIVGAGWIGCEVAAAARSHGAKVTMLDPLSAPLARVLGEQVGGVFAALHREHGVDLRLGAEVTGFAGDQAVREVRLAGGAAIPASTVVVGVGAVPNVALADSAGLALEGGGIAVDSELRTADPDIYAIGDVAAQAHPHYDQRVRVEHWANAMEQGKHVAANLLGEHRPYELHPFFFSDQYDLGCEYRGLADPARDRLVVRGELESGEFIAFWLRGETVVAALNVNSWDDGEALGELVESRRVVRVDDLVSGEL